MQIKRLSNEILVYNTNSFFFVPSNYRFFYKSIFCLDFGFKFLKAFAEDIPLENEQFDTIVITYTLCTIKDTKKAFDEIKRLLKPNGHLLFCEHGLAPDNSIKMWQNTINPVWKRVGGGCNLNKEIPELITSNGFEIIELKTMYLPGWKPASFNYWGVAIINNDI